MRRAAAVRDAREADLPAILAIYNHQILNTTAVWSDDPVDLEDRRRWLQARRTRNHPVLVAAGPEDEVLGFASFGDFRAWPGYRFTVEHSVYVRPEAQGAGVGRALLEALVGRARALGLHMMIAGIAADNGPSLALHRRVGFHEAGRLAEVGFKFGRRLDLVLLQKRLDPQDA